MKLRNDVNQNIKVLKYVIKFELRGNHCCDISLRLMKDKEIAHQDKIMGTTFWYYCLKSEYEMIDI